MISLFRRKSAATVEPAEPPLPDGATYDYTRRMWGHDIVIHHVLNEGQELRCSGWGPAFGKRIQRGDYLILQGKEPGTSTRYQATEIDYHWNPPDMWAATLRFAPRTTAGEG